MNKEEIEIIEKEINNLNRASQCGLASGKEKKEWLDTANAMKKMLKENKQLKKRINKVIEYCECIYIPDNAVNIAFQKVLEILKGE